MTREDIIRMAREAALGSALAHHEGELRVWIEGADWHDELARFAALAAEWGAKQEREACAKVCDGWTHADGDACAEAIRAKGQS